MNIYGVIIMGGKAMRLDGVNKCEIIVGSQTCLERVTGRLEPYCNKIILSAASSAQLPDTKADYLHIYDRPAQSGLDGVPNAILTILKWGMNARCDYIITTAADTPFLPDAFAKTLLDQHEKSSDKTKPVVSKSCGQLHGLHALWPRTCFQTTAALIEQHGTRSIYKLHTTLGSTECNFTSELFDPFFNINTPEQLKTASEIAREYKA